MAKEEKEETIKDTIEVDGDFAKAVADTLRESLAEEVKEEAVKAVKEGLKEATEKSVRKDVKETEEEPKEEDPIEKEGPEIRFMKASIAYANGDMETVKRYNQKALELRKTTPGYGRTNNDADGGYLVPDPDFDVAVERLEEEYGVALANADVKRINSNSVKLNKKASGFELTETDQAAAKTGVKMTIGQVTADLRKFAGIAVATDELTEDSAIDYWEEVTREFAYARSKKADELMFTDATSGLLEIDNTEALTVGSDNTDLDWDDLLDAEVKVPSPSTKNGKWFMHRTVWQKLIQGKASDSGIYHFQPNPNATTTPWGTPVVLTEILPRFANIGANDAFAVFGDPKHYKIYVKNLLDLTVLTEGTVADSEGTSINLAQQDMKALRGVVRMLGVAKFPEAFCLIGTGTVS